MSDQKEVKSTAQQLVEAKKPQQQAVVSMGFGNSESFALMQRAANLLANSTLVPVAYRSLKEIKEFGKVVGYEDNPSAIPNCVVALNMAQRMGADPLMVMQNLYIVEGRPSWSSQYIIAAINSCGRYSSLRFDLSEPGKPQQIEYEVNEWNNGKKTTVKKTHVMLPRTCVAWAIELATGDRLESPTISMDMAVAEGWITKNGSKWQTMPEIMLRYRAAAFFGKTYAPELLMGLQTAEEERDIIDVRQQPDGKYAATLDELREPKPAAEVKPQPDAETVEVKEAAPAAAQQDAPQNEEAKPEAQTAEVTDQETGEVQQAKPSAREAINAALDKAKAQSKQQREETAEEADYRRSMEAQQRQQQPAAEQPAAAPQRRTRQRTTGTAPE